MERITGNDPKWREMMYDQIPHGVCLIRMELGAQGKPEDWTFMYCNPALARMEGYTKEELIGRRFFELFPNSSHKWLDYLYAAAYENTYQEFDIISGEIRRYLHVEAIPVKQTGYCICVLRNVKEEVFEKRKQTEALEKALREEEQEHKILEKLCMDMVTTYYVELNSGSYRMLQISSEINAGDLNWEPYPI